MAAYYWPVSNRITTGMPIIDVEETIITREQQQLLVDLLRHGPFYDFTSEEDQILDTKVNWSKEGF